jgi:hypothetical protein
VAQVLRDVTHRLANRLEQLARVDLVVLAGDPVPEAGTGGNSNRAAMSRSLCAWTRPDIVEPCWSSSVTRCRAATSARLSMSMRNLAVDCTARRIARRGWIGPRMRGVLPRSA